MLSEHSQFARFAFHCGKIHMVSAHRNNKIYMVVFLEYAKYFGVRFIWTRAFWFERRVEWEVKTRGGEEYYKSLELCYGNWRLNFTQGHKTFHIGFKYRALLLPRAERLINMRINAARGNFTN